MFEPNGKKQKPCQIWQGLGTAKGPGMIGPGGVGLGGGVQWGLVWCECRLLNDMRYVNCYMLRLLCC